MFLENEVTRRARRRSEWERDKVGFILEISEMGTYVAYRLTGQSFKEWTNCAQNGGISCLGPVELPLPFTSLVAALVKRALNMSTNWAIGHMCSIEGEGRESVRGPFHLHSRFFAYDPYSLCCLPNPSRTHGPVRGCRKQTVVPQHG